MAASLRSGARQEWLWEGSLLAKSRSITLGVREEDFNLNRELHGAVLKQCGLHASGEGLFGA